MEVVVSVGVLAVALPLLLAAFAGSSGSNRDSREDTVAALAARALYAEFALARGGGSELLGKVPLRYPFPGAGKDIAVLVAKDGALLGIVDSETYQSGAAGNLDAFAIATMSGEAKEGEAGLLTATIELPAAAPADRRRTYQFHRQALPDED